MTRKIPVCPDCDSSRIFPRSGRHNGKPGWNCDNCEELKDHVTYRTPRTNGGLASGTLAHKLANMDPEDI
jgi:transposase-like protein